VFGTGGYLGICTLFFPPKKIAQVLELESGDSLLFLIVLFFNMKEFGLETVQTL
jgi:hypothetical protein